MCRSCFKLDLLCDCELLSVIISLSAAGGEVQCQSGGSDVTTQRARVLRGEHEEGVHERRVRPQHGGYEHVS